jgi:xanthine dehydrogenase molybdopterin-binding subunit B
VLAQEGKAFHYFAYGMSVSEVEVDVLTGEFTILRTGSHTHTHTHTLRVIAACNPRVGCVHR